MVMFTTTNLVCHFDMAKRHNISKKPFGYPKQYPKSDIQNNDFRYPKHFAYSDIQTYCTASFDI